MAALKLCDKCGRRGVRWDGQCLFSPWHRSNRTEVVTGARPERHGMRCPFCREHGMCFKSVCRCDCHRGAIRADMHVRAPLAKKHLAAAQFRARHVDHDHGPGCGH